MLYSTDPERLDKRDNSRENIWITLGMRNRRDFVSTLWAGGDRNVRDVFVGDGEGED